MKRLIVLLPLLGTACTGTAGSGLTDFDGYASGPPGVTHSFAFETPQGFEVTLTEATMHIGAVYLTASPPNGSSANTSCVNPGRYVAEVPGSVDMDVLSPSPEAFTIPGSGTVDLALTGEVWLSGATDDVNAAEDATVIVAASGTATRGSASYPFQASVHIGANRLIPVSDPSQPGLNPICKQRIVSGIPVHEELFEGGSLFVQVDPRGWFTNVDFSTLTMSGPAYTIPDNDDDANGRNLFQGIRSSVGVYSFAFRTSQTP